MSKDRPKTTYNLFGFSLIYWVAPPPKPPDQEKDPTTAPSKLKILDVCFLFLLHSAL
jgi:hypothetical protein